MPSDEALPRRRPQWIEVIRILILSLAAVLAVLPYLNARLVGGVDARWYAFMLRGYSDQIGLSHVPFLIGEGPFAWNGGVHPYRSAPIYLLLGGLWKVLTLGRLNAYGLQHLTVVTSAVGGVLSFYAGARHLLVSRPWTAAAFAVVYLCCPAWLATVYSSDAYMSYMAFAAMPIILFGNARTLMGQGKGYVTLGAGLALIWMCHPPIALVATTATLFIQVASIVARGMGFWRQACIGVAAFAVLSAYYFISMSEVPPRSSAAISDRTAVMVVSGIAIFLAGAGRVVVRPLQKSWWLCAAGGLAILGCTSFPWLLWAAITSAFWTALVLVHREVVRGESEAARVAGLFLCAVAGAAASEAFLGMHNPGLNLAALRLLAANAGHIQSLLWPVTAGLNPFAVFQPGWSIDAALLLAAVAVLTKESLSSTALGAAATTLVLCFVRIPLVSNFLDGYFPVSLSSIISLPLPLRIAPVLSSFALLAAMTWFAGRPPSSSRGLWITGSLVGCAALWSIAQASVFVRSGFAVVATRDSTAQSLRTENVMLDRYVYDLLHIPLYYGNGVTDPVLESRLVRADHSVLLGPDQVARVMEKNGVRHLRLVGKPIDTTTAWLDLEPQLTLLPGEHLLLRFEFDPARTYNGYLYFFAEHGYREYHMPDSGQPYAFGIGEEHSSVISLWNSGQSAEHYRMSVSREPGNDLDAHGGFFANLSVSTLDSASLPIRLVSLQPYHVIVTSPAPAALETFRVSLPGYHAWIDGQRAGLRRSREALLELDVPAGVHDIEVKFVGTAKLWGAAFLSGLGWLGLLVYCIRRFLRPGILIS